MDSVDRKTCFCHLQEFDHFVRLYLIQLMVFGLSEAFGFTCIHLSNEDKVA